jgi:hypothetical protein
MIGRLLRRLLNWCRQRPRGHVALYGTLIRREHRED